ncbi:hypothetical protein FHL15_001307 [Xylaria flabelliformis]|uniref:Uncharacterized protein n=1 Tax=Xylaria flabelliformis TaxID=2512241 RepID=A0A553IBH9_9PEZI|nr:hypothetical protein FHL15_001307 [Xylaria flabelliformis]
MTDANMSPNQEPIPVPVMGMTATEYQTAFAYLDHINFAREIEEYKEQRRRGSMAKIVERIPFYKRFEFWALILGVASFVHALCATWVLPLMHRKDISLILEKKAEQ